MKEGNEIVFWRGVWSVFFPLVLVDDVCVLGRGVTIRGSCAEVVSYGGRGMCNLI